LALPTNIRINTLAYYEKAWIATVNSYAVQATDKAESANIAFEKCYSVKRCGAFTGKSQLTTPNK
jgi:hypothetical protein